MSTNPNKAHSQLPGCHNGAICRHTHFRSHRGAELVLRSAGPNADLNALKTGPPTPKTASLLPAVVSTHPGKA